MSARSPQRSALITKSSVRISSTRLSEPSSRRISAPRQKYAAGAARSGDVGGSSRGGGAGAGVDTGGECGAGAGAGGTNPDEGRGRSG